MLPMWKIAVAFAKDAAKRLTHLSQGDNREYKSADMSSALDQVNTIIGIISTVVWESIRLHRM